MKESMVHNVEEIPRCKIKLNPIPPFEDEPATMFSQTHDEVLYLEDVGSYTQCKFETIGEGNISNEFEKI